MYDKTLIISLKLACYNSSSHFCLCLFRLLSFMSHALMSVPALSAAGVCICAYDFILVCNFRSCRLLLDIPRLPTYHFVFASRCFSAFVLFPSFRVNHIMWCVPGYLSSFCLRSDRALHSRFFVVVVVVLIRQDGILFLQLHRTYAGESELLRWMCATKCISFITYRYIGGLVCLASHNKQQHAGQAKKHMVVIKYIYIFIMWLSMFPYLRYEACV